MRSSTALVLPCLEPIDIDLYRVVALWPRGERALLHHVLHRCVARDIPHQSQLQNTLFHRHPPGKSHQTIAKAFESILISVNPRLNCRLHNTASPALAFCQDFPLHA